MILQKKTDPIPSNAVHSNHLQSEFLVLLKNPHKSNQEVANDARSHIARNISRYRNRYKNLQSRSVQSRSGKAFDVHRTPGEIRELQLGGRRRFTPE